MGAIEFQAKYLCTEIKLKSIFCLKQTLWQRCTTFLGQGPQ